MLTFKMSPCRMDTDPLTANWNGTVLTVNGVEFDLAELDDGEQIEGHSVFLEAERDANDYTVKVIIPHGYPAPEETRFPEDIIMTEDGDLIFPAYDNSMLEEVV